MIFKAINEMNPTGMTVLSQSAWILKILSEEEKTNV